MNDNNTEAVLQNEAAPAKKGKSRIVKLVVAIIFLLAANLLFFLLLWLLDRYDKVSFDQILYQLKSSTKGTNRDLSTGAALRVGIFGTGLTLIEIFIYLVLSGKLDEKLKRSSAYLRYTATRVCKFFKKRALTITTGLLICSVLIFVIRLDVVSYVSTTSTKSDFIEKNYVDPEKAVITFPEEKRNLIYIFLESFENTFSDPGAGGNITENFFPELTELRENNISFSNTDTANGGALAYTGTTWTAAALFAQTSGMIIKVPLFAQNYEKSFLPGITSLGDILASEGYHQTLLIGSDAEFACRDNYFTEHGGYEIIDNILLKEQNRLPADYDEWWGFEDAKLFDYAKEELTRISALGKPFNFTTLTADTHFPSGYECELCGEEYKDQYSNVIACSSKQVYEFVEWIKEQPFYDNTTVIISGDHLTMDPDFLSEIDENYTRTTYNCIINSPIDAKKTTERLFGTYDMFPTTLAAMGVEIEGDRLGLGTNLFSDEKTLTEEYGFDFLDAELQKKSVYYNTVFYTPKKNKKS